MKYIIEIETDCTEGMIFAVHSFAGWLIHAPESDIEKGDLVHKHIGTICTLRKVE